MNETNIGSVIAAHTVSLTPSTAVSESAPELETFSTSTVSNRRKPWRLRHLNCLVPASLASLALLLALSPGLHAATLIRFSAATYQVTEDAGKVTVQILRTNDVQTAVSVELVTSDGTAQATVDYTAANRSLRFDAGITNVAVEIALLNDATIESTKTFSVSLTNITGDAVLGALSVARVNILDNDLPVQVESLSYLAGEDDGSVTIAITRGDDGPHPILLDYTTASLTATPGQDYLDVAGSLTFAPGETVKLVPVVILNDGLREPKDTFRFTVTNISGGTLSTRRTATVVLVDNDPGIELTSTLYWVHEFERAVEVTVRRGNDEALDAFTVDYTTTNGTAASGQDFEMTKGTLHFPAGVMTRSFTIPIMNDETLETNEVFQVVLSNPSGPLALGPASSLLITICDSTGWTPNSLSLRAQPAAFVELTSMAKPFGTFRHFFDLHPLQSSGDLTDWEPVTLWHETGSPDSAKLLLTGLGDTGAKARFYRIPPQRLFSLFLNDLGPFTVGLRDFMLTDASRRNRFNISTNGSFPVSVWYPAKPIAGRTPERWVPEPMARDHSPSGLFYVYGEPLHKGVWMEWTPHIYSRSFRDLPFADAQGNCPVVLFSPGRGGPRASATEMAEHLASRGYVVVSLDHFDSWNVSWTNGFYQSSSLNKDMSLPGLDDRVRDLIFLVDQLDQWNQTDPFFQGKLDLNRLGVMGKSWGGASAGEFGRKDARCRATVVLDAAGPAPDISSYPGPSLTINASDGTDLRVFNVSKTNAFFFRLSDSDHGSLGSFYAFSRYPIESNREASRTINAYAFSFFNKYLRGEDDGLLSRPPDTNRFPRVRDFRKR